MKLIRILLLPFAKVWQLIISIRNLAYDRNIIKSYSFEKPFLLCVGNLKVGGTGKTPMTEFLIRNLAPKYKIAVLARGYGRRTKGFLQALPESHNAFHIGDEPFQYLQKFSTQARIFVGENRANAVSLIKEKYPDTEIILLDDAFQHRQIRAHLYIILTEFECPFFEDEVLPAGLLRESPDGLKRAHAVVVTKCPSDLSDSVKETYINKIRQFNPKIPVFFSFVRYSSPSAFKPNVCEPQQKIILFTGIANPEPMKVFLKSQNFEIIRHFAFPDHYNYKQEDIERLISFTGADTFFTTEKDLMRLISGNFLKFFEQKALFYLPIEFAFGSDEENLNDFLRCFLPPKAQ
jgi:tetraacyldisaccharide 4'-kinase